MYKQNKRIVIVIMVFVILIAITKSINIVSINREKRFAALAASVLTAVAPDLIGGVVGSLFGGNNDPPPPPAPPPYIPPPPPPPTPIIIQSPKRMCC